MILSVIDVKLLGFEPEDPTSTVIFYILYLEIKKGTDADNKYGAPSNT